MQNACCLFAVYANNFKAYVFILLKRNTSSSKHFSKSMLFNVYGELPGNHFFNNDTIKRANKLCKEIVHVTLDKGGHRKIL